MELICYHSVHLIHLIHSMHLIQLMHIKIVLNQVISIETTLRSTSLSFHTIPSNPTQPTTLNTYPHLPFVNYKHHA